jgi:hypothetical protein
MTEGSDTPFRLPVWRILRDTFLIPGQHTREFFKPLALPGLVIAVLTVGWRLTRSGMPAPVGWAVYVVYGAAFTVFAVSCHRLVLLGPSSATLAPTLRWGLRESKFLGGIILLAVIFLVARLLLMLVIANLLLQTFFHGMTMAIDGKVDLRRAWQQSARNGWRLVVIVGALPWVLSYGVGLMYRENATLPELVILVVLSVLTSTLGIIALSLSYQDLRSGQG